MIDELIIFEKLYSRSLPDPKAVGFMGHSDEDVSVLTHQRQVGMVDDITAWLEKAVQILHEKHLEYQLSDTFNYHVIV